MKKHAPLMILGAGSLWGCIGVFVRTFNQLGFPALTISLLRAVVCALSLAAILLLRDRGLFYVRARDLWCFLGGGVCSVAVFSYAYCACIELTSMNIAAVLLYTAPALVMLMSALLFNERVTRRKLVALALSVAGCALVSGVIGAGSGLSTKGLLLGLLSGLGYALYSIFSRFALNRGYSPLTMITYSFGVGALCLLPLADLSSVSAAMAADPAVIGYILVLGVVTATLPYLLYTLALRYMENSRASIIASVEPVVATLLGLLLFHEVPTLTGCAGMCLVLAAILLLSLAPRVKAAD